MYVLMVVPSNFPNGDAGAVRDMAFANIYQKLGYDVIVVGAGRGNREGNYQGVHYYSLYKEANSFRGHLLKFLSSSSNYMSLVNKIIKENEVPKLIHINSIPESVIGKLIEIADKNRIPIFHDSTEWYSPCEFAHGKLDKAYFLKDRLNRKVIKQPIRVIGISSYLTEHFKSRGLKSVRIPVIMDVKNTKTSVNTDEKIKLIYAGSPGNKDYLKEMVLGIDRLTNDEKKEINFIILGANKEQVLSLTGLTVLSDCIQARGRVPREAVQEALLHSDFSVLLRPATERYAKAGFPTKSVEAMAHGVAMLCNFSSDLDMYLTDMDNAVIVDDYTAEALAQAIRKILTLTREQINEIKRKAWRTAIDNFDYRLWIETVKNLIEE
jgi:glycosyltransferase involved in cell wall biosynthesis